MRKGLLLLLLPLCACSQARVFEGPVQPLTLKAALPVEGLEQVEPSGLTYYDGNLYTISDDHDGTIFKIIILPDEAILEPYIRFEVARPKGVNKIDFEGITHDEMGNFYLVSERAFRVLKVSHDGSEVEWVTPSLKSAGQAKGLFEKDNAYFEGITYLGSDQFILAAEREPRGIMRIDLNRTPQVTEIIVNDSSPFEYQKGRPPDYTGLYYDQGSLFILERGAHIICEIAIVDGQIVEKRAWSYAAIETDEAYAFKDKKYGRAEGLCLDDNYFFLIMDNGGDSRRVDKNDRRPLLFILERPKR